MNWILVATGIVSVAILSWHYAWWRATIRWSAPRILMYHMVSLHRPRARFNKLRVEPYQFERQLRWLSEEGWKFVFMSELGLDPAGEKCVSLTFDDGYRDNLLAADELLEEWQAKATLYLVVDRHDRDWSSTKNQRHSDGELRREPKLLDSDIEQMLQTERWELGAHTLTHPPLPSLPPAERRAEVVEARRRLEQRFGKPVESFAYPFGIYTDLDVANVQAAGYRTAVTTCQGISDMATADPLRLKRVKVSGNDGMLAFRLRMRTGRCRWKD